VVEDHRITIEHVVPSGPIRLQPEHHLAKDPGALNTDPFLEKVLASFHS